MITGSGPCSTRLELVLEEGRKLGLVGANGSGKSTLMRILSGLERPLSGAVAWPKKVRMGYLAQEPEFAPGTTVYAALQEGLAELAGMQDEYREVTMRLEDHPEPRLRNELAARQQSLHDRLHLAEGWDLSPRIEEMISLLNLPSPETRLDHQSGGTLKRVALGRVLLSVPELLFLDEPTNHLDTRTVDWLEKRLVEHRGTLVLITHDRYFLEAVVDEIAELSLGRLEPATPETIPLFWKRKRKSGS